MQGVVSCYGKKMRKGAKMNDEAIFMVAVAIFFVLPLLIIFLPWAMARRERNDEVPFDRLGSQDVDQRFKR
jgi:hypothetical protein